MKRLDKITEMHTDIKWIKKSLQGNGSKGLIAKVDSNTTWRNVTAGGLTVLSFLFAYGMIKLY